MPDEKTPFTDLIETIEDFRNEREEMEKNIIGYISALDANHDLDVVINHARIATAHRARKQGFNTALHEIRKAEAKWLEEQTPTTWATDEEPPTTENLSQRIQEATARELERTPGWTDK